MIVISGNKSAKARIVVDFPVPRSPIIITPPILGSITFNCKANFISSCPIIAAKGKLFKFLTVGIIFYIKVK